MEEPGVPVPWSCLSCCRIPSSRSWEVLRCEASTREDSSCRLLENFSICSMMLFRDLGVQRVGCRARVTKSGALPPCPPGEQSLMASLPRVRCGTGHGVDLPVLQLLQPLQVLLVVLVHLQDGGPGGRGRREGGAVNILGSSIWEGAALGSPCSMAFPPRPQALPPFPWPLCLFICLGASMPQPLSRGRFLVIQPRTPDRGPNNPFRSGQSEPWGKADSAHLG